MENNILNTRKMSWGAFLKANQARLYVAGWQHRFVASDADQIWKI